MTAKRMPSQAWVLGSQGRQRRTGETAPLVARVGVGLLYPSKETPAADLVVHGEDLLAVQVRRSLAPPAALSGYRVLPGGAQPRGNRPALSSAEPPTGYPLQRSSYRFAACEALDMARRLRRESLRHMAIFAICHLLIMPRDGILMTKADGLAGRTGSSGWHRRAVFGRWLGGEPREIGQAAPCGLKVVLGVLNPRLLRRTVVVF